MQFQIRIDDHTPGTGWTDHGRYLVAIQWFRKGLAFYEAAQHLETNGGHPYVIRNLLCQAIEICGKAYLLHIDFPHYEPRLRSFGHKLIKLAEEVQARAGVHFLTPKLRAELKVLSDLYSAQHLRYASGYDLLVDGGTIPARRVGLRFQRLVLAHGRTTYKFSES